MRDLKPTPFAAHLRRLIPELSKAKACYDIPERAWHKPTRRPIDARATLHGIPCGSPLGPAAGPHTQMAQNIVLSWVCGARVFELKTVQIMDRLKIPRPCIDARNICFNVEWSQELKIEESLYEYAAGAYLISIIRGENLLGAPEPLAAEEDPLIWDISVGYDLAGITSRRVREFLETMKDATGLFDRLDREMPAEFAAFKKWRPDARLAKTATLSTFHGCPPGEIEKIVNFLLDEMNLSTIVKMNPTMLGREGVEGLLRDKLGYTHLETNAHAYEMGLMFDDSVAMMKRLEARARARGLSVGAKFSNTLETLNREAVLPASEKVMYLSGAPLHVITTTLADKWRAAMDWMEPLSFSAGVEKANFPDLVACGCSPVTVCTDLLKPGGYGRLTSYLAELRTRMEALGAKTIPQFIRAAAGGCVDIAMEELGAGEDQARRFLAEAGAAEDPSKRAVMCPAHDTARIAATLDRITRRAMARNWTAYAGRVRADDRYAYARNNKPPKKIDSALALYDCINCDKCIPACPNDAMFAYETKPGSFPRQVVKAAPGAKIAVADSTESFDVKKDHQLANFADWCNECSNCMTYCPEHGGPFIEKPRVFGDRLGLLECDDDGIAFERGAAADRAFARIGGRVFELEMRRGEPRATLRDEWFIVEIDTESHRVLEAFTVQPVPAAQEIDTRVYHILRVAIEGILNGESPNAVAALAMR